MTRVWRAPPGRVTPPNAATVARRLLCVSATGLRAMMELGGFARDFASFMALEPERVLLLGWTMTEGLIECASPMELDWWKAAVGTLDEEARDNARSERFTKAPLAWALGHLAEMPPYDEEAPFEARVPLLAPTADFVAAAALRPHDDIEAAREIAELWVLRGDVHLAEDEPEGGLGDPETLRRKFTERLDELRAAGASPPLAGGDLRAFGKPYRDLERHEHWLAYETGWQRLGALNWLCGHAAGWDDVSVDPL